MPWSRGHRSRRPLGWPPKECSTMLHRPPNGPGASAWCQSPCRRASGEGMESPARRPVRNDRQSRSARGEGSGDCARPLGAADHGAKPRRSASRADDGCVQGINDRMKTVDDDSAAAARTARRCPSPPMCGAAPSRTMLGRQAEGGSARTGTRHGAKAQRIKDAVELDKVRRVQGWSGAVPCLALPGRRAEGGSDCVRRNEHSGRRDSDLQ